MKNSKITQKLVALILMLSIAASAVSCSKEEEKETEETETTTTTEETTEETSEETSKETTEETTSESSTEETEPEIVLNPNMDHQACSNEEDDARYMDYFLNEYPAFAERTRIESNYEVKITYVDLDADGDDELLIGVDAEFGAGVFCVVSEVDGEYHESDVYGWAIQHGANTGEYLGNGHFCGHIGNGNNYDSESQIYTVFEYDESLQNCGIIARYSIIYHPDDTVTDQLYTLADGEVVMYEDVFSITPDNSNYNYETEEHELLDGGDLLLEERYTDIEDSYRNCDDPYSVLEWRPVSEVIG